MTLGLCYSSSTLIPPRVKMKLGLCYSSSALIPPRVNEARFSYSSSTPVPPRVNEGRLQLLSQQASRFHSWTAQLKLHRFRVRATASLSHSKSSVVASPIPAVQIQPRPAT